MESYPVVDFAAMTASQKVASLDLIALCLIGWMMLMVLGVALSQRGRD